MHQIRFWLGLWMDGWMETSMSMKRYGRLTHLRKSVTASLRRWVATRLPLTVSGAASCCPHHPTFITDLRQTSFPPDPAGGAYSAPTDPLAGFEGLLLSEGMEKGMGDRGGEGSRRTEWRGEKEGKQWLK